MLSKEELDKLPKIVCSDQLPHGIIKVKGGELVNYLEPSRHIPDDCRGVSPLTHNGPTSPEWSGYWFSTYSLS